MNINKFMRQTINIGLVGHVSGGKTTFINSLFASNISETGDYTATTSLTQYIESNSKKIGNSLVGRIYKKNVPEVYIYYIHIVTNKH